MTPSASENTAFLIEFYGSPERGEGGGREEDGEGSKSEFQLRRGLLSRRRVNLIYVMRS